MIDFIALNNQMKTWIKDVTSLDNGHVINQNDNNPRPIGQYATVRIFDPIELGHDTTNIIDAVNDTVDINYQGVRQIMVGINIYRDDTVTPINTALSVMASLKSSLNRVLTKEYFAGLNIGIINASATRELSSVVNQNWESRKQADFFFYINDISVENIEAITKISGTGFGTNYIVDSTI